MSSEIIPLFEGARVADDVEILPRGTHQDQFDAWQDAWHSWLAELSENTRRAYQYAWDDLLYFTGKTYWQIGSADLNQWKADMLSRGDGPYTGEVMINTRSKRYHYPYCRSALETHSAQRETLPNPEQAEKAKYKVCPRCKKMILGEQRLSNNTVALRLAAISSFFKFVSTEYMIVLPNGKEQPLHNYNPTLAVKKPKTEPYENATFLEQDQGIALLQAIPHDTPIGLRNYALILFYLLTGRRNAEVRRLRWEHIRVRGGRRQYYRKLKRKQGWSDMPEPVWAAIKEYLQAVGRLENMKEGDYVFTAISPNAGYIHPDGDDFDPFGQPLGAGEANKLLKRYAKAAGIDTEGLSIHSLRHTFASILFDIEKDVRVIQAELGHSGIETTMGYMHSLKGNRSQSWKKVGLQLGLDI